MINIGIPIYYFGRLMNSVMKMMKRTLRSLNIRKYNILDKPKKFKILYLEALCL